MTIVAAFDRAASMPSTFAAHCAERWIFHLADPIDAIAARVSATDVPSAVPGRIVVASSGLHAQLAFGDVTPSTAPLDEVPPRIECLPRQIAAEGMPTARVVGSSLVLPMGVGFADGQPAALEVPDGEHIVIVGPARSGRTTVLQRVVEAWREIHPDGWFTVVEPRRRRSRGDEMAGVPPSGPVLLAIDDAELLDDERGELAALIGEHRRNCLVVAAGKGASLRHSYGHWTGVVRRSRIGVVLAAATDVDADLLGVQVPRRLPIAARPGLAWLIGGGASGGEPVLAQVATSNRVFPAHLGALEHSA
jgi:S-DNA-T family DNA segregation ATPase FtsK/SpoIIIE